MKKKKKTTKQQLYFIINYLQLVPTLTVTLETPLLNSVLFLTIGGGGGDGRFADVTSFPPTPFPPSNPANLNFEATMG